MSLCVYVCMCVHATLYIYICVCVCTYEYVLVSQVMCEPFWFCLAKPGFESRQSFCGPREQAQLLAEPCCLRLKHLDLGCQDRQELRSQKQLLPLPHQNHPISSRIIQNQHDSTWLNDSSTQIQRHSNWFNTPTASHSHTVPCKGTDAPQPMAAPWHKPFFLPSLAMCKKLSDTSPARKHHVKTFEIRTSLLAVILE